MNVTGVSLTVTAFVFGVGFALAASSQEDSGDDGNGGMTRNQFVSTQSYFLNGSGLWRQENPSHKDGDGTPVAWLQSYKWGPGRDSVIIESQGLHDDGSCEFLFVTVQRYDPAAHATQVHHFGAKGLYLTGATKLISEDTVQATLSGVLPNGAALKFRDTKKLDDPAAFSVHAARWDEKTKEWQDLDAVTWTRSEDEARCAKS